MTAAPAATPAAQPGYGQPAVGQPGYGQPAYGQPGYGPPPSYGGGLGDVGEWLSATFSGLFSRILSMSILLYFVPVVGMVIVVMLVSFGLRNVRYISLTDQFTGFEPSAFVGAAIGLVIVGAVSLVCWLAANHQMHTQHIGQPVALDASFGAAVGALPRTIGWGLLGVVVAMVALGVAFVLPFTLAFTSGSGGAIALAVLFSFAMFFAFIYFMVRLGFTGQAMALAPAGTNPFAASWRLTQDRFWGVFGRVLLLTVINWLIQFAFQIIFQIVLTATVLTTVETDPITGELLIDGERFGEADRVIGDVFPSIPVVIILTAIYLLSSSTTTAVSVSAYTWLYGRGGGPTAPVDDAVVDSVIG